MSVMAKRSAFPTAGGPLRAWACAALHRDKKMRIESLEHIQFPQHHQSKVAVSDPPDCGLTVVVVEGAVATTVTPHSTAGTDTQTLAWFCTGN
jgi:hypothetical protein